MKQDIFVKQLKEYGRDDVYIVVGGVIPRQDYDYLYQNGANAGLNNPLSVDERVPANWSILPEENGIRAFNNVTRRVFIGSIQEFNARLKE